MKQKNGITLIALIITIIVILILAGISIIMMLGENGILEYSKASATKYKNAEKNEIEQFEKVNNYIMLGNTREDANSISNINIFVDDVKQKEIPSKESNKIYAYYSCDSQDVKILFDKDKWSITISGITNSDTVCNIYFYEKDNLNAVKRILNIDEQYENVSDFIRANLANILENSFAMEYIVESNGEIAKALTDFIDNSNFQQYTNQASYDGNNTTSLNLAEGRYLFKLSCNCSFNVTSFLVDGVAIKQLSENMYLGNVKKNITVNWYCNHYGVAKYLTISYKKI